MGSAYFTAALPEPYQILGLRLKPLSLGRYRLLKRFGCAFVADEEASAGINDLILGLVICSLRVEEFMRRLEDGTLKREVRKWGRKICPCAWMGLIPVLGKWWRRKYAFDVFEKEGLFSAYLRDGSKEPKFWDENKDGGTSGAHWAQSIEVILRSELGWTDEEINEAPLTKALADYFKFAESQGFVRLMSDEELRILGEAANGS
jgi:hypothetical protein